MHESAATAQTSAPPLKGVDHIHVFVSDRAAAVVWYGAVLGMRVVAELESWAADGGPLTIGDVDGSVHLALFERPAEKCRSTVALSVSAQGFLAWQHHLEAVLQRPIEAVDHQLSWSLYFSDPDGNPFEITSTEVAPLHTVLGGPGDSRRPA